MLIESPNDEVLQEDIEYLVYSGNIPFDEMDNKTVLITGATGLIGSQLVKTILCCNRIRKMHIKVLALIRNREKAEKIFAGLLDNENLKFIISDIIYPIHTDKTINYIIHGASITDSQSFVNYPVETINTTINGTKNILELAKEKKVNGMVYLSSLEVYGITDSSLESINENNYGYIDILKTRSSYSESKRLVECLCISYAKEFDIPVKIARLGQTFGAGVEYSDKRVFAQFARSVIEKKNIILKTSGETARNYCYVRDAVAALIFILINGKSSEAYNIANTDTYISISDMANLVVDLFTESEIKVNYDLAENIDALGYNPTIKIKLNSDKLKSLGWVPSVNLPEIFIRMVKSMKYRRHC